MNRKTRVLVIGANGQLGAVLIGALQEKYGMDNVIGSDIRSNRVFQGIFEIADATDQLKIHELVSKYKINQIYHLAAILSAKGEKNPLQTWEINMKTLFAVLEVARITKIDRVFFPSSIAVFGAGAPMFNTPDKTYLDPATIYGISKAAGENWGQYYYLKYGLDVRSLRFPGVIGYQSLPGGGTTDYAVDIYHKVIRNEEFTCFLKKDTTLPMIFMDDAIRAISELMDVPKKKIKIRTSYNISGVSFSPAEVVAEIHKLYPDFKVSFKPDFRQDIAASWPKTIDDSNASKDWGWKPKYDLEAITRIMIQKLKEKYRIAS